MGGFFTIGEKKDRPGIYKRRVNAATNETVGERAGIGAAVVTGDYGPLNKAVIVDAATDLTPILGSASGNGCKVVKEMLKGGVENVVVVRVGTGGTAASVTLKDTDSTPANVVTLTAKCPGTMDLSVTIKTNLVDSSLKDIILYAGTQVLESFQITAGAAEVAGIIAALADSEYVTATKVADGNGTLATVTQSAFAGGVAPTVNTTAYGNALDAANAELFDVVVIDSDDTTVHAVVESFVQRIFEGGDYPIAVLSEPHTVALSNRLSHAAAFNDEKIVYVLGGWTDAGGTAYDGYLAAARIGGMVAAIASNDSLTHKAISGAIALTEALTNSNIIAAIKSGCLVISRSKTGNIQIEKGINTLVTTDAERDAGWKKIRRTKTRFEMMNRIEVTLDPLIGAVSNDNDGRAAIIAAGQSVLDAMVGEGKIMSGATFALDENYPPVGDSAWFVISVDDIDSFETGYLTFQFRFSPES